MINRLITCGALISVLTTVTGCQIWPKQEVQYRDPALPMTLNCEELVTYLNNESQGLDGWRCTSTRMHVRLPNGMGQRLKGSIACQAPNYFRLTASNVIASADLGSNDQRCWVYVKPGEPAVMTWKHEDTSLLQQIPGGVPYIDPNWLMLVLGVTPLDANDYDIQPAPGGTPELWLTAIQDTPSGRPIRRLIKVDTIDGVIREHAIFDSESNPIVRAQLSKHTPYNGKKIPHCVKLMFPQMDSEMRLTFYGIETNPHLPKALWQLPDHNLHVVDLGQVIRSKTQIEKTAARRSNSNLHYTSPDAFHNPRAPNQPVQTAYAESDSTVKYIDPETAMEITVEEPEWATPASQSRVAPQRASPPKRRGFFSWFRRR